MARKARWQKPRVEAWKTEVRAELSADFPSPEKRLAYIVDRIEELAPKEDAASECRRYIYVMSSLVHHERHGGLTPTQINRAADLALALLASNGITPGDGKLAYLHGELHLVMSHIHRQAGDPWMSAWEHRLIQVSSRKAPPGGSDFQALSTAGRSLRLGDAAVAVANFRQAEQGELPAALREKARLGLIKALRLSDQIEEAKEIIAATDADFTLSEAGEKELSWESACLSVVEGHSPGPLVALVRKNKPHHESIYLLETHLWTFCYNADDWRRNLAKVRTMARRDDLRPQNHGIFHRFTLKLEETYEADRVPTQALREFGKYLSRTHELNTIDKELLIYIASANVFLAQKMNPLAELCLAEYRGLCLRLTSGRTTDVLRALSTKSAAATPVPTVSTAS